MATSSQWLEGARLRTLPAAVSPVLAGSGIAAFEAMAKSLGVQAVNLQDSKSSTSAADAPVSPPLP